jgi:hypothetical protein
VLGSTLLASINLACASEKEDHFFGLQLAFWAISFIAKVLPSLIEGSSQRPYREVSRGPLHNWRSVLHVSVLLNRINPRKLPLATESEPRDAKQTSDSRDQGNAGFRGELTRLNTILLCRNNASNRTNHVPDGNVVTHAV